MPDDSNPPLPAPPCFADPDVHVRLASMEETLKEIRTAVIGNPKLGHRGLVCRVDAVEAKVETHDRKLVLWGGIVTAGFTALTLLKDRLIK